MGANLSAIVAQAQWESGAHQAAIQMVRAMQPWTFETGLEQTVGLAPLIGTKFIERQRVSTQAICTLSPSLEIF